MSVLETLKFVTFRPLRTNDAVAIRRRKLIAKIDEQIQFSLGKIDAVKGSRPLLMRKVVKRKLKFPNA